MTLTFPLSLTALYDTLHIGSVSFDVQRNDELSGTGDGRVLAVELAPPLWIADVNMAFLSRALAQRTAAKIRSLQGPINTFMLADPAAPYPLADPKGTILGARNITIASVPDRSKFSLQGLPAGYLLQPGDKMQIVHSSQPVTTFHEVSEDVVSSGAGVTPAFNMFPFLPGWAAAGMQVILARPACRCIIMPGTFKAGDTTVNGNEGMAFRAIQKR